MNFDSLGAGAAEGKVDPQLMAFIGEESHKQKFQAMVHSLNDVCWDVCMPDRPPAKMDSRTETCLGNCVNRFIDASAFVLQRLQESQAKGGF